MPRLKPGFDPRTKLVLGFMGAALVLFASALTNLMLLCAVLLAWAIAVAPIRDFGRWLILVLPMALFFGVVTAVAFTPADGLISGLKLTALTTVGYLFFVTTPPEDLANALIKAGLPFQAAFVMSAGMQFVPVLARKAREVMDAQKARGIPINAGWRMIRRFPAFAVPLLIQSFQLAEELAEAMESRGFGRPGRSYYKSFSLRTRDYFAMGAGGLMTLLLIRLMG